MGLPSNMEYNADTGWPIPEVIEEIVPDLIARISEREIDLLPDRVPMIVANVRSPMGDGRAPTDRSQRGRAS